MFTKRRPPLEGATFGFASAADDDDNDNDDDGGANDDEGTNDDEDEGANLLVTDDCKEDTSRELGLGLLDEEEVLSENSIGPCGTTISSVRLSSRKSG